MFIDLTTFHVNTILICQQPARDGLPGLLDAGNDAPSQAPPAHRNPTRTSAGAGMEAPMPAGPDLPLEGNTLGVRIQAYGGHPLGS
jgi:hypothetical protein